MLVPARMGLRRGGGAELSLRRVRHTDHHAPVDLGGGGHMERFEVFPPCNGSNRANGEIIWSLLRLSLTVSLSSPPFS